MATRPVALDHVEPTTAVAAVGLADAQPPFSEDAVALAFVLEVGCSRSWPSDDGWRMLLSEEMEIGLLDMVSLDLVK